MISILAIPCGGSCGPQPHVYPLTRLAIFAAISAVMLGGVWLIARARERRRTHGKAYRFDSRGRVIK